MMLICKILLIFLLLFTTIPSLASTDKIQQFILYRHGSPEILNELLTEKRSVCHKTTTHYICGIRRDYKTTKRNPLVRQSVLNSVVLKTKYLLHQHVVNNTHIYRFENENMTKNFYLSKVKKGDKYYVLKNIEYISFANDRCCIALAAASHGSINRDVNRVYNGRRFLEDYSQYVLPEAERNLQRHEYIEALSILKELYELNLAKADVYILTSTAFIKNGKNEEARKVALDVLQNLSEQLDSELAEDLGDIFIFLGLDKEAEVAYTIALNKFRDENE